MKKLLLLAAVLGLSKAAMAQGGGSLPCVVTQSYSLSYVSGSGSSCTFAFQPTVTVNQSGASVKLAEYTFTIGNTTVQVCYTGNGSSTSAVIGNCSGPFSDLPAGPNQVFPKATIQLPCQSGSVVLRGSTSTQGTSTCTSTTLLNGPLPAELVAFEAASKTTGVELNWATQWESKNAGFDVEKSKNASTFEAIGNVKGRNTTNLLSTYSFLDANVQAGETYYYRLKQKDTDGAFAYSRIISVRHSQGQEIPAKVFPNASIGGSFMLSMLNAQSATLRLFNEAGVEVPVVVTKTGDPNLVSVAPSGTIAHGLYVLKVFKSNGEEPTALKVLVQ